MCLTRVESAYSPPRKLDIPEVGYKIFIKRGDNYYPYVLTSRGDYIKNQWYKDKVHGDLGAIYKGVYPTGFHIFKNYMDAYLYKGRTSGVICKVLYDDVVAIGEQGTNRMTIVARKFKIIEEID